MDYPNNESSRNHPLKEKWNGYRSITPDADLRLRSKVLNEETMLFVTIGTYQQLYK